MPLLMTPPALLHLSSQARNAAPVGRPHSQGSAHRFVRSTRRLAATAVVLLAALAPALSTPLPERLPPELARALAPWQATLVIVEPASGRHLVDGDVPPDRRSSPCSTFKIFHGMVGLETGVLQGLDHRYRWDGVKHDREADNKDHTLRTAIRDSCVWYFQRLANEVGTAREKAFLAMAKYGNQDVSAGLTQFWLDRSLQISPDEQVAFLARICDPSAVANGAFPFSPRTIHLIREGLVLGKGTSVLRGKTGSAPGGRLGWFVGWVERGDRRHVFALRLERRGDDGAPAGGMSDARPIMTKVLQGLGLY